MPESRADQGALTRDPEPAALDAVVRDRLASLLRGLPTAVQVSLGARPGAAPSSLGEEYWLQVPSWLWQKHRRSTEAPAGEAPVLLDLLWAQYCLFRAVCIRDDLFDGQAHEPALGFAADLILIEAENTLAQRFGAGCRVCEIFRQVLETTIRAILEVDMLQRRPTGMPAESLDAYARVGEVFKLAYAGVLEHLGHSGETSAVWRLYDHLAIAGQIVDDLDDLEEDLCGGRVNYAASRLLETEPVRTGTATEVRPRLARALVRGHATAHLLGQVRWHLSEAKKAGSALGLPAFGPFMTSLFDEADQLEGELHRARVAMTLGRGGRAPRLNDL